MKHWPFNMRGGEETEIFSAGPEPALGGPGLHFSYQKQIVYLFKHWHYFSFISILRLIIQT